ncbi:hypothetical protein CAPTEDRAFT_217446 [Capitella teleta]|uniref:Uncharacterized protein n=1 Tax=Capitella teleta TaxID=283909 RepID=R7VM72_CAPTE|nr:hypothetical protein CAPTEDRAFT_217446 [Capitella teleta]|eukprot:ELU18335.1 hypothetical protein CAPTEDRAFT_217446 [Capitella teleta]
MDHYNRHAKERDELQELQRVWFKKESTANWKPASVIERPSDSPRAYIVQDDAGTCFQRTTILHVLELWESDQFLGDGFDPEAGVDGDGWGFTIPSLPVLLSTRGAGSFTSSANPNF